ncbi:MAG: hypothetical protein ACOY3Z_07320 [Thermodesulfobacteriota bacterium]
MKRAAGPAEAPLFSLAALAAILLAAWLLHGDSLGGWWCCDDPQILKQALRHSPVEYFTIPEVWRSLIPYSLTPWLTLAYDLDAALFGLAPAAHYAHNLLAIAGCAMLIFVLARQWVAGWPALAGALLFLAGSPIALAARQLMVRHYVEGLLFFLLAALLVVRGVRENRAGLAWPAGLAFAVAACAKEVYLPLGLAVFLLPEGGLRQRLRRGWPLLLVMAGYVPWRWYMLGRVVGGYTPGGGLEAGLARVAFEQLAGVPALLFAAPWLALTLFMTVGFLHAGRGNGRWLPLAASLPILLLAPLLPLVRFPGLGEGSERFFIAPWAIFSLAAALLIGGFPWGRGRTAWHRGTALLLALALLVAAAARTQRTLASLTPLLREQQAQGQAILSAGDTDILFLSPALPDWYVAGLTELRQELGGNSSPPRLVADEVELLGLHLSGRRVLRYEAGAARMVDLTAGMPDHLAQWRKRLRPAPLSVDIAFDDGALSWRLGPHAEGSYLFLAGGRQVAPPQGMLRMERPPTRAFRIRHDAPDGTIAYTPPLALTAANGYHLSWRGTGDLFPESAP